MSDRLTAKFKKGKPPQHIKHGGYSFLVKGELPENRKLVLRYLTGARAGLITDLGPTEDDLTAAQIILIDRVICKLGVCRCIEEHIRETTVMKGEELAPALKASYLAYNNSIRLDLTALGLDTRQSEVKDLAAYINAKYPDDPDPKEATRGPVVDSKSKTRARPRSAKANGAPKAKG